MPSAQSRTRSYFRDAAAASSGSDRGLGQKAVFSDSDQLTSLKVVGEGFSPRSPADPVFELIE